MDERRAGLKRFFGFDDFRAHQEEVCRVAFEGQVERETLLRALRDAATTATDGGPAATERRP